MKPRHLIELKDSGDPAEVVTKALAELQTSVESRIKEVETKSADAAKLGDRLDKIEAKLARPAVHTGTTEADEKKKAEVERKAYDAYLRRGREHLSADEVKTLFEGGDPQGGYLNIPQFSTEVVRLLTLISPVRRIARINPTANSSLVLPVRASITNASWEGETSTASESEPGWAQAEIAVHELRTYVDISNRLLEDSAVDVVAEVTQAGSEDFAKKEGLAFVSGSGTNQPAGFATAGAGITYVPGGDASYLTYGSLVDLFYALPQAYRESPTAAWAMNGSTIGAVRKLTSSGTGLPLWTDSLQVGQPPSLLGKPVVEMPDLPDVGANALPIYYGDWQQAYRVVDRVGLTVLRDPFSQAANGIVRFHMRRRVGGQVVKAEALRALKISVS